MLDKEQLSILNDIFHSAIKPVFEENEEVLEDFMNKVDEHENWIRIQNVEKWLLDSISKETVTPSPLKNTAPKLNDLDLTMEKVKHQFMDLNIEKKNHNIVFSTTQDIVTTQISIQTLNRNVSPGTVSRENPFAA